MFQNGIHALFFSDGNHSFGFILFWCSNFFYEEMFIAVLIYVIKKSTHGDYVKEEESKNIRFFRAYTEWLSLIQMKKKHRGRKLVMMQNISKKMYPNFIAYANIFFNKYPDSLTFLMWDVRSLFLFLYMLVVLRLVLPLNYVHIHIPCDNLHVFSDATWFSLFINCLNVNDSIIIRAWME